MIGPYTMKTGDIIYLWNGKVGVNAQTLPFPFALNSSTIVKFARRLAFTRCQHILKTVKNSTDRPPVQTKTAHFLPADFENGRF